MTLPHSMDYLMNNGILNFDAAAYLNSNQGGVQYPSMLNGVQMQSQPANDSFSSKAKAKLKDPNFLKKAATAVIVGTLAFVGIKKGKNILNSIKGSKAAETVTNAATQATEAVKKSGFLTSVKNAVVGFFKN